jgi:hypothetical protein
MPQGIFDLGVTVKNSTLCQISQKTFEEDPESIKNLIRDAEFICKKCLRSAKKKQRLCKPVKMKSNKD